MSEEEVSKFNFLEAAARVYLLDVLKIKQPCVTPRTPEYRKQDWDRCYFVRYKAGNNYILAHVGEKRVMFKQRIRSVNITNVSIKVILKYLETRHPEKHPSVLIK